MLNSVGWFVFLYYSIGVHLLMEGIVFAWETTEDSTWVKILGTLIAVTLWPSLYTGN